MWEFLIAPYNLPFISALFILIGLFALETTSLLIGLGFSQFLDNIIPEIDMDTGLEADIDLDGVNGGFDSGLHKFFAWLCPGKIPLLVILTVFLTVFGLTGILTQWLCLQTLQMSIPPLIAVPVILLVSLPATKQVNRGIYPLLPKDESSAICHTEFIGLEAVITLGTASYGNPAEARLTDRHGQNHYLLVQPDQENIIFERGSSVIVISQEGNFYTAIRNELSSPSYLIDTTSSSKQGESNDT